MKIESVMTPRLFAIADSVPQGARLCDVGTDHGYIPIYLCLKNQITSALAMDLRPGPLFHAEENIRRYRLEERVKTRLSDGLLELSEGEADTAVIAGMGGLLIAEILEAAKVKLDCYILQPMTAVPELRQYLASHGYRIDNEVLAREEEKIYSILTVRPGKLEISNPIFELVGEKLLENHDPLLPELIEKLLAKFTRAHRGLKQSERADTKEKEADYQKKIESLLRLKEECRQWSN